MFDRKFHGSSKNDCLSDIKKGKVEIVVTTFETFREHQVKCRGFYMSCYVLLNLLIGIRKRDQMQGMPSIL